MATIVENLQSIIDAKADIKAALIEQGQSPTNDFSTYGDLVRNIKGKDESKDLICGIPTFNYITVPINNFSVVGTSVVPLIIGIPTFESIVV